ncbi:hypothetical protein POM88_033682 [Heracleum sosnowskyi]|uniref:Reverse transcriptase n=1 Tax=Heracleum sosnowskyi TaxID=360622 RepID=A0AAD8M9V3_9APIA|nr:hypothetical protein POM88_033682 [Heracleum sosnowskyi]
MKILSWNCRGIGNPCTVNALRGWCWRDRPNFIFLMVTKNDGKRLERVQNKCGFSEGVSINSVGNSGGMGFWWRDVNVVLCSYSAHHFEVNVLDDENVVLVMFGDFNEIIAMSEKDGGSVRGARHMDAFRETIDFCQFRDTGFKGSGFTWQRGNTPRTLVRERLDRFLANDNWCELFPQYEVSHLPIYRSDHAPILLKADVTGRGYAGDRRFIFEALWLSNVDCEKVIQEAWNDSVGDDIPTRLKFCSERLLSWAKSTFGNIKKRIKETEKRLKNMQNSLPDANSMEKCKALSKELDELHRLEESYWHARARANELRDGDKTPSLKERIWKKLRGWKEKLVSRPGKEILIKAVAQAIPTYMMSIFRIPDGIVDDIHAILARFWWGNKGSAKSMHWYIWDKMLLKARYFKNSDVIKSNRGHDPIYTWRSIWGLKSLLLEGLKWRVGNGTSICVWDDIWLPGTNSKIGPLPNTNSDSELRVSDLIDYDNGKWNSGLINELFGEDERASVLDIPLSSNFPQDRQFWYHTKNGEYTVRSVYWLARTRHIHLQNTNDGASEEMLWKTVWGLEGPPKLSHFLWRACKGSLVVMERVFHRHIIQSLQCQICGADEESIIHALFDCTYASEIWSQSSFLADLSTASTTSLAERVTWIASKMSKDDLRLFGTLMWARLRKKGLWRKRIVNKSATSWSPPPAGCMKINTDAHVRDGLYVGLGVVIRNSAGQVVAVAGKKLGVRWGADCAEAAATLYGLEIARCLGHSRVILECDALNVISTIKRNVVGFSPMFLFYEDIRRLQYCFEFLDYIHIRIVAHCVARRDINVGGEMVLTSSFPQTIVVLSAFDYS